VKLALVFFIMLLAAPFASGQQIPCAKYDEQTGPTLQEYTMKGCRSFNELQAAGGINIDKVKEIKSYACFATTSPKEASDFFVFVTISGVISLRNNKVHNGFASMKTFLGGLELNKGFTNMTWTQYPKENPFLWSAGTWVGHGDAQMYTASGNPEKPDKEEPDSAWKAMGLPRLHVSADSDTVELRLELNNEKGAVEALKFNRWTGRGRLDMNGDSEALLCVSAWEQK
jgi:hypothetical protein